MEAAVEIKTFDEATELRMAVEGMRVEDEGSLATANDHLLTIKDFRSRIGEYFDPLIKQANTMHKGLLAKKKAAEAPLVAADKFLRTEVAGYLAEAERKRIEAEEKARKAQEEAMLEAAAKAEEQGHTETAEAILETAVVMPTPPAPRPALTNMHTTKTWKFKITDPNLIPREYLKIDEVKIGGVVRALKGDTKIPGVQVFQGTSVAVRR